MIKMHIMRDAEHDMCVDFTYKNITDELPGIFDEDAVDYFINNLNNKD